MDVAPDPELIMPGTRVCVALAPVVPYSAPRAVAYAPPPIIAPQPPVAYAPPPVVAAVVEPPCPDTAVAVMDAMGYPLPLPGCMPYEVCINESLWSISEKFGMPLPELIAMNPQIPNPDLIFPGQTICIG